MAISAASLSIDVTADTSKAQSGLQNLSGSIQKVVGIAAGFSLGNAFSKAPGQLIAMGKAAADDAASVARLQTAVNANTGGWDKYGAQINKVITAGQKLAFTDDDTRGALSLLEAQTGNTEDALSRLTSAEDLARGANIDLGTAAKLLGKVTDESASALGRYGIHVQAGATAQEALNAVDAKFKGQAGAFAASDAGKFAMASDKIGEMQEALGAKLLPALGAAATGVGIFATALGKIAGTGIGGEAFAAMAAAIGGVLVLALGAAAVSAYGAAAAFIAANAAALPWIALAALIGVGIFELIKHWDDLTARMPILQTALDAVKVGFHDFVMVIIAGGTALGQVVTNIVDVFKAGFDVINTVVESFGNVFDDVIHGHFGRAKDDAVQGAKDIANAYVGYGDALIHVFDNVGASFEQSIQKQTSGATKAGDAFIAMKEDMNDASGQVVSGATIMGEAFKNQLAWIDRAVHSLDDYKTGAESAWAAQSALNDMLSEASGQVSFWEGNLKTANDALDILNKEQEKNGSLTQDQQTDYDILTQAVGRYQGGIEDSHGAVVDAATAQAQFILIQDDLNGKLAAGTITQGEYNTQMADATSKIDPATSAAYGLATAQDSVATAVDGVVNKLGNMLIDLGLLPESKRTEFQTPGLDDGVTGVHNLGEGIGALPSSFTITADVDIAPAMDRIQQLRNNMPFSPAKEGPFSKLPNWSAVTEGIAPAFADAIGVVQQAGAVMMGSLGSVIDAGAKAIGRRLGDAGVEHGHIYGNRVRDGAEAALDTAPTIGDLILAAAAAGVDPLAKTGELAGKDVVDALVNGVVAGLPEWQNIFELMHGDALTALAQMQTDLQGKIRLAGIAGDDTADLQAKLDAVTQIIQTWAEQTGLDFQEEVNSILAPDISPDITQGWLDLLGNIDDIVSGDFQKGLQDQLTKITNELTVAVATGAPQSVIDALTSQQAAIEAQLTEAGLAYQAAIDAGMTDPDAWAKTQEQLQQQVTDTMSYLDALANGSAITDAQDRMAKAQQELALAYATGASQDVIQAINKEFVDAQADFNKAASDTSAAIAAGIASPEAIKAYNEAMGIVTQIPIDQLLATLPDMSDFGVSLIDDLAAGIVDGSTTVDDAMSVLNGMVAASLSDLDDTNDLAVSDIIAQLQTLEEQLTGDLAQAFIDGSDPSAISANLAAVEQLLADLQAQADATAASIEDVFQNPQNSLKGGAYTGGGIGGKGTSGGGGSGTSGTGAFFNTGSGAYPVAAPDVTRANDAPAPTVNVAVYATLDGAAITQNVETRVLSFARAM